MKKAPLYRTVKEKINKLVFFNKDQEEKKQYYAKICKPMIQNLWNGLCEIPNFKETSYEEEIEAYHGLEGIGIPTHGFIDLYGEYIIETKTLWPRRGKVKLDGNRSWSSKSPPTPDKISIDHLSQVALYHAAKNKPVYLVYASDKTWKTYHKDNCPALEPENLKKVLKQLTHKAKVMENLLSISTDPKELVKYIIPQFDHYKWQNESDNTQLEEAKKFWGYK